MCQKGLLAPERHEKGSTIAPRRGRQAILSLSAVNAKPERQQGRADRPGQLPKFSLAGIDSGGSSRLTPERCGFMEASFDRSEVRTNRASYWKGKIPRMASPRKRAHQEKLSLQAFLAESDPEGKKKSFSIATSAPGGCLVTSILTGSEVMCIAVKCRFYHDVLRGKVLTSPLTQGNKDGIAPQLDGHRNHLSVSYARPLRRWAKMIFEKPQ